MSQSYEDCDTDVVVVGAGPGGCTLAYLLARSGVDVQLLERQRDLDRTFRGYLFQPHVLRNFDEMGILDSVLDFNHETVRKPAVSVYGRTIPLCDLSAYDQQYGYNILMEQPPLLRHLIDRSDEYDCFGYRDATTVQDLLVEDGHIVGVTGTDREAGEEVQLTSRLVVGADGRYSTVREAADIDPGLMESDVELVWFKLPATAVNERALARFNGDGVLGYFGLGGGESQLGHFVKKDGYAHLRSDGIDAFHNRVIGIDPSLDGVLQDHVQSYRDTTLLHIEPGLTDEWVDDGLLLLGDAAHVASPIAGQGNGLAIADSVASHPIICDALDETPGTLLAETLREYERERKPTVQRILQLQRRVERVLSAFIQYRDRLPTVLAKFAARGVVSLAALSPLCTSAGKELAWGSWEPVATSKFVDSSRD